MRLIFLCLLACLALPLAGLAQGIPVFVVTGPARAITFAVSAAVPIAETFDKWDATLTFASTDATTGALRVTIQAASVTTGSGIKDGTLKSEDFFDVKRNPLITFASRKMVQTGLETFEAQGDFTIRGVTKPETLLLTVSREGQDSGQIKGTMTFGRRDYGMNRDFWFLRIDNRVEVTVTFEVKRVGGPPLVLRP
jgi:polyisoprenoid-binding protein YceI